MRRTALLTLLLPGLLLTSGCGLFGGDDDSTSVFSVKPGECFEGQTKVKAQISDIKRLPCSDDHALEAYAVIDYEDGTGTKPDTFPGDEALTKFAQGACAGEFRRYVGVDYLDSSLFYTYLVPSARSWEDDDRNVVCFATSTGEPLQGSVKGTKK